MPKDSTVQDLDELYRQAKSARARLEPGWFLNLAYYENEQWLAWNGTGLFKPSMPKSRVTLVDNRIQPIVRKEIARMTKNRPVFVVTPTSSDAEDTNAAELGEQIMRYLWKHLNLQQLVRKGLLWSRICGAGFLKCYWDSTIGEKRDVLVGPDGKVLTGQDGRVVKPNEIPALPGVTKKTVAQGDIKIEVRSPFQMFIDPLADTFEEAEWLVEESVKSAEYVNRRYGVDLAPDTAANPGLIQARMGSAPTAGTGSYRGLKIREYWSKASPAHPNGRRAVWVMSSQGKKEVGQLLEEDGNPCDPMPYVMFSGIPAPGRLWPMSVVDALRGPQTELNKLESQMAENRNRVGNPTTVMSKQAVQDPEKAAASISAPGGILWIDDIGSPNSLPVHLPAPPLPNYVVEERPRIEESMQEISGQHEVTSAQVPPGVTAASAINLLQEADDTMIAPDVADYELQLGKLGQKCLGLVGRYYTDARTIALGGDKGQWQIFDFRGSNLRGNTHIEVQAGSAFPQSKAAKQAMMQDILTYSAQSGQPIQGQMLARFYEDFGLGAATRFIEQFAVNEQQVNRENALLAQGQPLPINEYDDDKAHVDGHTDFQKESHYQQLNPVVQRIFELHVQAHRERMAEQQQAQMQLAMQMQGQPSPEQQGAQQQQELQGQAQQQQLSAAQAQQQMQLQGARQDQQQGFSQAQSEQQQRQAEELHAQKLRHTEEAHQHRLRLAAEQQRSQSGRNKAA